MIRDGQFSKFNRFSNHMEFVVREKKRRCLSDDITIAELLGISMVAVDEIKLMVWAVAHQMHAVQWEWAHARGTVLTESGTKEEVDEYERLVNQMAPLKEKLDAITAPSREIKEKTDVSK